MEHKDAPGFQKVYVVAAEYWHPNSCLYEGNIEAVMTSKAMAVKRAELLEEDGLKTQVYGMYLEEGEW